MRILPSSKTEARQISPEPLPRELADWVQNFSKPKPQKGSQQPSSPTGPSHWSERLRRLWQLTLAAGRKLDQSPWQERARQQLWLYNVGQVRGLFRGLQAGALNILRGPVRSTLEGKSDLAEKISHGENEILSWTERYLKVDWESKGEMAGEATARLGSWFLKVRLLLQPLWSRFSTNLRSFLS